MKQITRLNQCRQCGILTGHDGLMCPNCEYSGRTEEQRRASLETGEPELREVKIPWNERVELDLL